MKKYILCIFSLILVFGCASKRELSTLDAKSREALSQFQTELNKEVEQGNHLLSPGQFSMAEESLDSAKDLAYDGEKFDRVKIEIEKGREHLKKLKENVELASFHLKEVLKTRDHALKKGAQDTQAFQEAEEELRYLGEFIEEKDINELLDEKKSVTKLYQSAEIKAIQEQKLADVYKQMEQVKSLSGQDYFDQEFEASQYDILSAEKLIRKYPHQSKQYASAIEKAHLSTARLLALVKTATWLEKSGPREASLKINNDLTEILRDFAYDNGKELGYVKKVNIIKLNSDSVPLLLAELSETQYDSYLKKKKLTRLKNEKELISSKYQNAKLKNKKIRKLEELFGKDEAEVLVKGDDVIVRLIGLNFDFNEASLPDGSESLLQKIAESAKTLQYPELKIVGHADSTGNALYNEKLSRQRALRVNDYLVEKTPLKSSDIKVVGMGFRRPIEQNKTSDGRKANRRIDIVFNSVL